MAGTLELFRRYWPGMRHATLHAVASSLAGRETRRTKADGYLSVQDVPDRREFDDTIGYTADGWDINRGAEDQVARCRCRSRPRSRSPAAQQPGRRRGHCEPVTTMGSADFSADGPILVLGATGTVGSELVRQLAAGGASVRAFVRDEARAREVLGRLAVEYARGDLSEPETVQRAARGCGRLFLLTPDGPRQVALATGAARAAVEAGVAHIVSLSSSDSARDAPFAWAQAHHAIEEHVENLGIHFTHLRPHYFMTEPA